MTNYECDATAWQWNELSRWLLTGNNSWKKIDLMSDSVVSIKWCLWHFYSFCTVQHCTILYFTVQCSFIYDFIHETFYMIVTLVAHSISYWWFECSIYLLISSSAHFLLCTYLSRFDTFLIPFLTIFNIHCFHFFYY